MTKSGDPIIDDHHARESLRLIRAAIAQRWDIPREIIDSLPKIVARIAVTGTDREKLRAAEVLARMQRDNLETIVQADRIERLEAGEATEIVQFPTLDLKAK
jgi:hypothetical protein